MHSIFPGDAAFAISKLYETLEASGYYYAIRLRTNRVLQGTIAHLLKRPVGRPPKGMKRIYGDFEYGPRHGASSAVSSPKSNGTRSRCFPALVSSSVTYRWSRTGLYVFTISVASLSSTSRKASQRSTGCDCSAMAWRRNKFDFSFTHWPTISVSSCRAQTFPSR